jgi:hypothetical protein
LCNELILTGKMSEFRLLAAFMRKLTGGPEQSYAPCAQVDQRPDRALGDRHAVGLGAADDLPVERDLGGFNGRLAGARHNGRLSQAFGKDDRVIACLVAGSDDHRGYS